MDLEIQTATLRTKTITTRRRRAFDLFYFSICFNYFHVMNTEQVKVNCLMEKNAALLECVYDSIQSGDLIKALNYQKLLDENLILLLSLKVS